MTNETPARIESAQTRPLLASLIWNIAVIVCGVVVMTVAAKTQVLFYPVPMTLHTAAVMAFALALSPRMSVAVFVAYLAAGAAGFPVFAGTPARGIGLAYMMGPTGGYLLGYLIASGLVAVLAAGRGTIGRIGAMLLGLAVVYACGVAWLAKFVAPDQLFALGIAPFILGDLVKIALVAAGASVVTALLPGREVRH
jgi:biotin transport system substrate-specific component